MQDENPMSMNLRTSPSASSAREIEVLAPESLKVMVAHKFVQCSEAFPGYGADVAF